ncbi:uncharacterized protein LOC107369372 [Tetranychus urticae]|uniref:Uncharacterized protein n=1 Tax=Tetranychus urticae TaxID=32264 RepID=T1L189_TETUR|nr:uncharacterized protein LOC107369371 [Tetranychus urticae]XP_015792825.1 uncharacterized protein LOC107369372 [Tetranychus urticae]
MRFTIILTLCFIGAVSASSLNRRSFIDDIQNNTRNSFYAFEQFGENFNMKVQEAFENLFSAFGNKSQLTDKASVSITNGSSNSFDLVAFAQDLLQVFLLM